jgi:phosphatidate cytidylyltransferase
MTVHQNTTPRRQMDNNTVRILTGLVLIPVALGLTYLGGWFMFGILLLLVVIGTLEFYHMEKQRYQGANTLLGLACGLAVLVGFFIQSSLLVYGALGAAALATFALEFVRSRRALQSSFRVVTTLVGVLYLAVPAGCLLVIRAMQPDGLWWIYALYLTTWGTDICAYFVGRQFGRHLLAPQLSPKKTVEGAIGGVIGGILLPFSLLSARGLLSNWTLLLLVMAPFVAIWGDLLESAMKRYFGLKDSGIKGLNVFPGHGGVLDRVDALVCVTGLFYTYLALTGKIGF